MKRFVTISMRNGVVGIFAIAISMAVLNVASPAGAAVLNVDWKGGSGDQGAPAYDGLGAAPDAPGNTTWNGLCTLAVPDWGLASDLVYSDGSAAAGVTIQKNGIHGGRTTVGELTLFDGSTGMYHTLPPQAVSIDICGLNDSSIYDVYLIVGSYYMKPSSRADFTINGVTKSINGHSVYDSFVEDTNYIKFVNQSSTDGELNIGFFGTGYPDAPAWAGMQLVEVPEPGALMLLTTGLVSLLCYAWRRRK